MASSGKKKTTMAKLSRESRLRERRLDKKARKDARKLAAANGTTPEPGTMLDDEILDDETVDGEALEGAPLEGAPLDDAPLQDAPLEDAPATPSSH
ncbi:MAG TPA: hypothetical protein VIJ20_00360 [Solirubrobacteraceae bacterium]